MKDTIRFEADERSVLRKKGIVQLSGEIGCCTCECFVQDLLLLGGRKQIDIYISSPGGDVSDGLAMIAAIRGVQAKGTVVRAVVYGHASSMAAVILEYCDVRVMDREAILMMHGIREFQEGDIKNAEIEIALLHDLTRSQAAQIALRCKQSKADKQLQDEDYWCALLTEDTPHYFLSDQAKAAGLIDEVV